jgi:GxxExxY protein
MEMMTVEVKPIRTFSSGNEAQLVNYLTAVNIDVGLLINFGARRLEFKRKTRILRTA